MRPRAVADDELAAREIAEDLAAGRGRLVPLGAVALNLIPGLHPAGRARRLRHAGIAGVPVRRTLVRGGERTATYTVRQERIEVDGA